MTIYTLYKKTHNIIPLNYLGQTTQDPFKYKGSGKRWLNHINKHGNDVTTEILGTFNTKEELKEAGVYYSRMWCVVESILWANLKEEEGDGGFSHIDHEYRISQYRKWSKINRPIHYHPCFNCNKETSNPKFCSSSCNASYNNKNNHWRRKNGGEYRARTDN